AIYRALSMPIEERRARQEALYRIICESDIKQWPEKFLSALAATAQSADGAVERGPRRVPFIAQRSKSPPIPASRFLR
ncbi:MAG: hypothetical protein ABWY35_05465, partial [Pseudorhodoplanes sp.]